MIEYTIGMRREFGVDVGDEADNALEFVRATCGCSRQEFRRFVNWYFNCYALVAPISPYDLAYAWEDFVEAGECLPTVVSVDRMEMKRRE